MAGERERAREHGILCIFGGTAPSHGCACVNCKGVKLLEGEAALARKEAIEECCKAICIGCQKEYPREGMWHTLPEGLLACYAYEIHERSREEKG